MAFIVYPKNWVAFEVLKADDLNRQFAAISAVVNGGITDTNISALAGIRGTKIASAPNGIGTAQINDHAVTFDKLAPDAVRPGVIVNNSITSDQIQDGTIQTIDLHDGAVTRDKLGLTAALGNVAANLSGGHADISVPVGPATTGEVPLYDLNYVIRRGYFHYWANLTGLYQFSGSGSTLGYLTLRVRLNGTEAARCQAISSATYTPPPGTFGSFAMPLTGLGLFAVGTNVDLQLTIEATCTAGPAAIATLWKSFFVEELS